MNIQNRLLVNTVFMTMLFVLAVLIELLGK
jgi:hypothetical protein